MRSFFLCAMILALVAAPGQAQEKAILKTNGYGSLSGVVTYDGDVPKVVSLVPVMQKLEQAEDRACCLAGPAKQKVKPNWIVDPKTKGVANVVIWLKVPDDKTVFPVHIRDRARKETVIVDQPFCAFVPHVTALYPQYHNGKKEESTEQKFLVKNSSIVAHNIRATTRPTINDPFNINMPAKTEREFSFKPQPLPVILNCDFHKFMNAYVFVFDHPYFAITDEQGKFTMPRVPAGAEVTIMAWHEETFLNALGVQGKKVTFKDEENEYKFSIK